MNDPTRPDQPTLNPADILGLKFLSRHLPDWVAKLHADQADPKRKLFFDQYLCLQLLSFYSPALSSLRALQAATQVPTVQRRLDLPYAALGSLSEASRVFDPELLRELFEQLAREAGELDRSALPAGLPDTMRLIAADGSLWKTLPRMAKALYQQPLTRRRKGGFKGHFQFDIAKSAPVEVWFTAGETDERGVLQKHLRAHVLYLLDRGYQSAKLYAAIQQAGSSFVGRIKESAPYQVVTPRPLGARDAAAGVYFDAIVRLGSAPAPDAKPLRVVKARVVSPPPHNLHPQRHGGKYQAYSRTEPLVQEWVLLTDRLDLDADVLVLLYHHRWKVELFFRWFKCTLKCAHLFCESENGMKIQFYAALIASLLVVLYTGRKPNKRIWEILQLHWTGWATWADVQRYIAKYGKPTQA
jgi:hypothetical protein